MSQKTLYTLEEYDAKLTGRTNSGAEQNSQSLPDQHSQNSSTQNTAAQNPSTENKPANTKPLAPTSQDKLMAKLRPLNSVLSVILCLLVVAHALLGSALLMGWFWSPLVKILGFATLGVLALHVLIGIASVVVNRPSKEARVYPKDNRLLLIRRISGVLILVLIFFHLGAFGTVVDGEYVVAPFTAPKLISGILLILAIFTHMSTSIRSHLVSLGAEPKRKRAMILHAVEGIFFLVVVVAFVVYFVGWL